MTGLLDTNVALYLLGGRLNAPLPKGSYGISAIVCATAMELGVDLWTNDLTLARVPGLSCRAVSLTK